MKLKTTSKFIIGLISGVLITLSLYSFASSKNDEAETSVNVPIPVEEINNFAKVYAITKNYYVESASDAKLMKGAISGILTNLDPHSAYLDQNDFKQLAEITKGSFAGLGIEISRDKDSGGIKVVAPIDGTPAYTAGIKSGDVIIKIDNQPVSAMALDEAIKKMRGKAGTKVEVTISRKNVLKPLIFNIVRANIDIKSVKLAMLTPDYAYIRVTNFQSDTVNELTSTLVSLHRQAPNLKGIIMDLRDNPGGILQSAVGVVGAFTPVNSLVVYTKGRAPDTNQKYYVMPKDYNIPGEVRNDQSLAQVPNAFKKIPLVVLVNQGSASASEIVSGALQDYGRAKIVGTKTFGKGSVQSVIPLSQDTAVKLTTALYYTPKGRSIQAQGIKPDIIIKSEYSDLYDSWDLSEANLDNHLNNPNPSMVSIVKDKDNTPVILPPKQLTTEKEIKTRIEEQLAMKPKVTKQGVAVIDLKNDFQLQWALNIVQGKSLPINKSQKK